jgi:hypothetical protein
LPELRHHSVESLGRGIKLDTDEKQGNQLFHLESGVPVFNSALEEVKLEQAEAKKRDEAYKKAQLNIEADQLRTNKWLMRFTGALVICTLATGGISGYTSWIAKRSADAAEKAATIAKDTFDVNKDYAKQALDQTKLQTKAQQDSATITRESLESVQRAFVVFDEMRANSVTGGRWTFYPLIRNLGATTAIDSIHYFNAAKLLHEPNEAEFVGPFKGKKCARVPIGPKASPQLGFMRELDETLIFKDEVLPNGRAIKRFDVQNGRVYVWGWSAYRDVFPNTPIHVTEFCQFYVNARTVRGEDGRPSVELISADCNNGHNCTDEGCKDYKEIMRVIGESSEAKQ